MGLDYGTDGALYVCNNTTGEVLRMVYKDNALVSSQVVASGLRPNGLKCHNGYVYVTQPKMLKLSTKNNVVGGVYRFKETERQVQVSETMSDSHLLYTATATNPNRGVSLDGLTFDSDGNLFVAEFGDATIYKLKFDSVGDLAESKVYAQLPQNTGIDGMYMDQSNNLYVTGFSTNRLICVSPDGDIKILAEYPNNDGAKGELDQPVDVCIYDGKLLISNFGAMVAPGMVNQSHDKPYTLSYIDLETLEK